MLPSTLQIHKSIILVIIITRRSNRYIIALPDILGDLVRYAVQVCVIQQKRGGQITLKRLFKRLMETYHQGGIHTTLHQIVSWSHSQSHLFQPTQQIVQDLTFSFTKGYAGQALHIYT